ncbi:MAG: winged helix-turn-helix domain-containing protein [Acidimicrobiales bacterium]
MCGAPGGSATSGTVDVHVRQLRKKLGDAFVLTTVWGVGYRLDGPG